MGCASSAAAEHPRDSEPKLPPASKLYRHALESVLAFCSLQELHAVLAVSREWSAAVDSMHPICYTVKSVGQIPCLSGSRLSRHVLEVHAMSSVSFADLHVLSNRLPWLEQLSLTWTADLGRATDSAALSLSQMHQLTRFRLYLMHHPEGDVTVESRAQYAVAANQLVRAVAGMQRLEEFRLFLLCSQGINLAPLAGLNRLRELFVLTSTKFPSECPSVDQVTALRQMSTLEQLGHNFTDRNGILRLLLQAPTPPLRWTSALVSSGAADLVPQLQSLPSLTGLDVQVESADVGFLMSFPRLISLTVSAPSDDRVLSAASYASLLSTLTRCPQISVLSLQNLPWSSAELGAQLTALPRLSELTLNSMPELTSLSFLNTAALSASLTSLSIFCCVKVPSSEIEHLLPLRPLRLLNVIRLREPLSAAQQLQLRSSHPRGTLCQ